jgi:hypothetical protein
MPCSKNLFFIINPRGDCVVEFVDLQFIAAYLPFFGQLSAEETDLSHTLLRAATPEQKL